MFVSLTHSYSSHANNGNWFFFYKNKLFSPFSLLFAIAKADFEACRRLCSRLDDDLTNKRYEMRKEEEEKNLNFSWKFIIFDEMKWFSYSENIRKKKTLWDLRAASRERVQLRWNWIERKSFSFFHAIDIYLTTKRRFDDDSNKDRLWEFYVHSLCACLDFNFIQLWKKTLFFHHSFPVFNMKKMEQNKNFLPPVPVCQKVLLPNFFFKKEVFLFCSPSSLSSLSRDFLVVLLTNKKEIRREEPTAKQN